MDFLKLKDKTFFITGVANKKSVAYHTAKLLEQSGAKLIFSGQTQEHLDKIIKLFGQVDTYLIDVEDESSIIECANDMKSKAIRLDGLLHSIAFANLANPKPFHETSWKDWAQADRISCFSLAALSGSFKELFNNDASVVTVSISDTKATSYGYLGPIKAALETSICYLAKSFSEFSSIRFNSVCAGPLKTSASAGIPDYIDNYIYAEKVTMRKKALLTQEVANTITFLLSPASSGINASGIKVDAGMRSNFFDQEVVKTVASHI